MYTYGRDRSEKSKSLYFPDRAVEDKDTMLNLLLDIDCNLSKFICMLMPQVITLSRQILAKRHHYKKYNWKLTIELKEEYK